MRDGQGAQVSDILLLGAQVSEGAHFEEAWLSNDYNFHRRPFFCPGLAFSKSHVCVVGIVLMMCIILCSKLRLKWLCSKVMLQTAFQSDPATPLSHFVGWIFILEITIVQMSS